MQLCQLLANGLETVAGHRRPPFPAVKLLLQSSINNLYIWQVFFSCKVALEAFFVIFVTLGLLLNVSVILQLFNWFCSSDFNRLVWPYGLTEMYLDNLSLQLPEVISVIFGGVIKISSCPIKHHLPVTAFVRERVPNLLGVNEYIRANVLHF